ncbi:MULTISPECIES: DNA-binding response regulator [Catenuloplanes]|uniref:DNA-binding NarL/FixJ family response regulator n=1 Tax=Catenuloplanes niger TaxID=587534 RepID=A0AAE4CQT6_9ACTN|nr:DNA-binding response regulator [Catenuloplanes niger]MDR7320817.1 DNA-binding NarL/FixJ family response regulator [Catenuloplanes niger]
MANVLSAAGHQVETPTDPVSWAARRPSALVLLTMAGIPQWRLLDGLRTVQVIALVDEGSASDGVRAVRAGARSVLPRGVAHDSLRRAVEATIDGQSVLPTAVVSLLANGGEQQAGAVDPDRIAWLGKLASGMTVAQLATQMGYSERAMFRLLAALYREIGASNRIEAVVHARDRGWI